VIIETHGLGKSFRRHRALQAVSLAVPEGGIYTLIGPNGAGKTTIIKTLVNIERPTTGSATVLGVDSRKLSPTELRQIGYVSENQELPARLRVGAYFDYLRPFYPTWDPALERALIRDFQLPIDARIGELSHGTRVKVALTCALSYRPKLLVMDEPFGGLDPLVREELLEKLLEQADEMTVFVSSHELDEIEGSTTYIGYLENGELKLQEELASVAARVRRVRVTLRGTAVVPERPPAHWLDVSVEGSVLGFIDVAYADEALRAALSGVAGVEAVEVEPVALRSIFTALARAGRRLGQHT
jgi:ABC-2 type transport system ATP-binding protein